MGIILILFYLCETLLISESNKETIVSYQGTKIYIGLTPRKILFYTTKLVKNKLRPTKY